MAYAYAISAADRGRELGCVYLRPLSVDVTRTITVAAFESSTDL